MSAGLSGAISGSSSDGGTVAPDENQIVNAPRV